jgi:mono/diheme cytochrome c family protein
MTPARRRILLGVGAIIVIAAAAGIWIVRGPGPMAFAEGQKVALADYKAGDPTGVPTSHAGASLVERGEYLTTDADALAIKAYLFSLPPVRAVIPANTLTFPFNQRWAMTFWSLLFNSDTRFAPDASKSLEWNRGAYLTEAFAHCGECHTPRSVALALDNRKKFAGAVTAGWRAFNITSDKATGIGDWRDEDIIAYLSVGHATGHGTASGPMGEAVDHSFSQMAPEDIRAVVVYLRTVPPIASSDLPGTLRPAAPASHKQGGTSDPRGKIVFEGACVSCHGWTGESPISPFATLTGALAVNDPSATNVAQVVISGTVRSTPEDAISMRSATPIPTRRSRPSPTTLLRASAARDRKSPQAMSPH